MNWIYRAYRYIEVNVYMTEWNDNMSAEENQEQEISESQVSNNPEYFLFLLTPVQGRIYAYILSRWPNKSDADDIMQESISILWRKFHTYEPGTEFLAWAFTVTKFVISGFKRKHKRDPIQFSPETLEVVNEQAGSYLQEYDFELEALRDCLKKLSPDAVSLLKCKYEDGWTSKQIASRFGMSLRTFYRNIAKTHAVLLRCMSMDANA